MRASITILSALLAVGLTTGWVSPAAAQEGKPFAIRSELDNRYCIDPSGLPGSDMSIQLCDPIADRIFHFTERGEFRTRSAGVGPLGALCIDGRTPNGRLTLQRCTGEDAQIWQYTGSHQLRNQYDLCIDIDHASPFPGAPLLSYSCTPGPEQRWSLVEP